jgi:hypothetical protein
MSAGVEKPPNVLDTLAANVPLKDGAYIAVVVLKPKLLEDRKYGREAVRFTIKVVEGVHKGRLVTLELLTQAPELQQARVDHDVDLLDRWRQALGIVDPVPSWPELIEACRAAAIGKRVEFTLWQRKWNGNLELRLSSVKVLAGG